LYPISPDAETALLWRNSISALRSTSNTRAAQRTFQLAQLGAFHYKAAKLGYGGVGLGGGKFSHCSEAIGELDH